MIHTLSLNCLGMVSMFHVHMFSITVELSCHRLHASTQTMCILFLVLYLLSYIKETCFKNDKLVNGLYFFESRSVR